MPTNNPKVSAYIPQDVFDRFQLFCKEKKISMSQAVAVIFTEYFEIEPQVNFSGGLLLDRIKDLELKVDELMGLKNEAVETQLKGGELQNVFESEPLINDAQVESYDDGAVVYHGQEFLSELNGGSSSNLQDIPTENLAKVIEYPEVEKKSGLAESLSNVSSTIFDLDSIASDGLTTTKLAERFGSKPTNVSSQKAKLKLKPKKFIEWSKKQDPDGWGWEFRNDSSLFYRVPPASLSEEEAKAQTNHP